MWDAARVRLPCAWRWALVGARLFALFYAAHSRPAGIFHLASRSAAQRVAMSLLRSLSDGLRFLFRKEQVSRELEDELNGFLEMAVDEKVKQGMSRKDALRAVRLERGSLDVTKEIVHAARWESFLEACWQDVRFGVRVLRKRPGFTVVAVLTLALGIGANTAVFSVVESVLLRPLQFEDSERLFAIWAARKGQPDRIGASMPEFEDYKDQSQSFEFIANMLSGWTYTWTGQGEPRTVNCTGISHDFFPMLGVKPYMGRLYEPG